MNEGRSIRRHSECSFRPPTLKRKFRTVPERMKYFIGISMRWAYLRLLCRHIECWKALEQYLKVLGENAFDVAV